MKIQKELLYVVVGCSLFLGMRGSVYAHPPKPIIAKYDADTKILVIKALHKTKEVKKHYVERIEVSLNGKKIIKQEMFSQPNKSRQVVQYTIVDAEVGDKVKISARCSIFGSRKKTIVIKKKKIETKELKKKKQISEKEAK